MKKLEKILKSKAIIRFQDCDPFNHLNNAAYLNYFTNAREDQIKNNYGIDIYAMAKESGISWVVGSNQIAYINPAFLMEDIVIESQLLNYNTTSLFVELRMWNNDQTKIKAIMWSRFVHFNLIKQKRENHSDQIMKLFERVHKPVDVLRFEDRVTFFKKFKVAGV